MMHKTPHNPPPATSAEKAAAFDRIAAAYREILEPVPPDTTTAQLAIAKISAFNRLLDSVEREVKMLHPHYRKPPIATEEH